MARKVVRITIKDPGRDQGKTFVITEMPTSQSEMWAVRAFLGAANHGIEIPTNITKLGIVGLATYGLELLGRLPFEVAKPLLEEMFTCIQIAPNPRDPSVVRGLIEDDIEEVKTRFTLRGEVFKLHVDFIAGVVDSISASQPTPPQTQG